MLNKEGIIASLGIERIGQAILIRLGIGNKKLLQFGSKDIDDVVFNTTIAELCVALQEKKELLVSMHHELSDLLPLIDMKSTNGQYIYDEISEVIVGMDDIS